MKRRAAVIGALLSCLLFSCANGSSKITGEWITVSSTNTKVKTVNGAQIDPFNTTMVMKYFKNSKTVYASDFDDQLKECYLNKVVDLHKIYDRHYDYYNEDGETRVTNVKTINDSYGTGEEIYCSDELYNLLKMGVEYTLVSNGYYNFFSGELVDFWDYTIGAVLETGELDSWDPMKNEEKKKLTENYAVAMPTGEEVKSLLTFNDAEKSVIFNALSDITSESGEILERSSKEAAYRPLITSGGIAKGVATDDIKKELVNNGYTTGWLSSGSSSITLLSEPSFEENGYQNIGFADPRNSSYIARTSVFSIRLYKECNLSTSGNYTSGKSYTFKDDSGKTIYRHHIVNPYTGENAQYHRSVTLVSSYFSSGALDALSTAFVNLSTEDGLVFRKQLLADYAGSDLEVIFIDSPVSDEELAITSTSDFSGSLTLAEDVKDVTYAS